MMIIGNSEDILVKPPLLRLDGDESKRYCNGLDFRHFSRVFLILLKGAYKFRCLL
jgi:hypothetical protein